MKDKNSLLLILLVAGVVSAVYFLALVGTSMTGLVVATYESEQTLTLNSFYEQNQTIDFERENLTAIKITGNFSGNGTLLILLQLENETLEIYGAELENETITFTEECLQTCELENVNSTQILIRLGNETTLYLEEIKYKTSYQVIQEEQEPVQGIQNFTILINETLTIDLLQYFEGDEIFFDAMTSEGYTYSINQSTLEITPVSTGTWRSKIYAVVDEVVLESEDFFIEILSNQTPESEQNKTEEGEVVEEEIITQPIEEDVEEGEVVEEEIITQPIEEDVEEESSESEQNETEEQTTPEETIEQDLQEDVEEEEVVEEESFESEQNETEEQIQIQQVETGSFNTRTATVQTTELQGVLNQGQTITIIENYYSQNTPQRNDLIAFNHAREGTVFSIIKGISGDAFRVDNNRIYINNQIATNSQGQQYVISDRAQTLLKLYERDYNQQIPQGAYLILGNVVDRDTGSARYGLVHISDFEGRITN